MERLRGRVVGRIRTSPTVQTAIRSRSYLEPSLRELTGHQAPQHRLFLHAKKVDETLHTDLHSKLKAEANIDLKQSNAQ